METLFKIALRNIRRHIRRTITSAITIAAGLSMFIFMNSLYKGMDRAAIDNMINLSTSSIKINSKEYLKEKQSLPLDFGISSYDSLQRFLKSDNRIKSFSPRTEFLGQLSNYSDALPVVGTVINHQSDSTVFNLHEHIDGNYFSDNSDREIIIGKSLAKELKVNLGDFITLQALTRYESRNADEFKIIGLINTTDPTLNKNTAIITYHAANDFLDLDELITEVNVQVARSQNLNVMINEMEKVSASIEHHFSSLSAMTFKQLGAAFFTMSKQKSSFGVFFMLLILLIASVGIFNTILMSVYERIKEVGILRAHGMNGSDIMVLFCMEGFFTGILGGIFGLVCGSIANVYLIYKGFPLELFAGNVNTTGIPVWGTVYGEWNIGIMLFSFIFSIIVATIAGIIPAFKASRLHITETLRFV